MQSSSCGDEEFDSRCSETPPIAAFLNNSSTSNIARVSHQGQKPQTSVIPGFFDNLSARFDAFSRPPPPPPPQTTSDDPLFNLESMTWVTNSSTPHHCTDVQGSAPSSFVSTGRPGASQRLKPGAPYDPSVGSGSLVTPRGSKKRPRASVSYQTLKMKILLTLLIILAAYEEFGVIIADGVVINCDYQSFNFIGTGSGIACLPQSLDFSDNEPTRLTAVTGEYSGTNIQEVTAIRFDCITGADFDFFPTKILDVFPNLRVISFISCSLDNIECGILNDYTNLGHFSMFSGNVKNIPADLFANTPNILYTAFANNGLESTGDDFLSSLSSLQQANMRGNPCVDVNARGDDISSLIQTLNTDCPASQEPFECGPKCELTDSNENLICDLLDSVAALESADQALSSSIDDLNTKYENGETQIENLTTQTENLSECVESLKNETAELKLESENLAEEMEALKNETAELGSKQEELEGEVETLKGEVGELQGQVQDLEAENENLKCLLATLQGKVEKIEEFFNPGSKIFIRNGRTFVKT